MEADALFYEDDPVLTDLILLAWTFFYSGTRFLDDRSLIFVRWDPGGV
jgi:hypothetical protein